MKMGKDYQISSSMHEGILEIVLKGKLITSDVEGLQIRVTDIVEAKGAKALLVDSRKLDGRNVSIAEMFVSARRDFTDKPKLITAVVDRLENSDLLSFMETTALNAGWKFKWFTDMDAARDWLKSKQTK
ncbi:MAG: hypothetical protein CVU62_13115 [Deltaproteobacteria bacterium HGW-Deltaproteobacteria-2]|jgi:hypothetical protein|nr:MAG: hypothetical protein CVU62_13115 [Deltaproteobacteria bacterium HGW-Deltaproteobacteria-2]